MKGTGSGTGTISNPALGPALQGFQQSTGGTAFFSTLIPHAVAVGFIIGTLIFFFMIVVGAIEWISSGGDKQKLESARGRITNAIIGIIVLFASYAIIKVIERFFGISILSLNFGPLAL